MKLAKLVDVTTVFAFIPVYVSIIVSPASLTPSASRSINEIQPDCQVSELAQVVAALGLIFHSLTLLFRVTASLRARCNEVSISPVSLLNWLSSRKLVSEGSAAYMITPTIAKVTSTSTNEKPAALTFMHHPQATEKYSISYSILKP